MLFQVLWLPSISVGNHHTQVETLWGPGSGKWSVTIPQHVQLLDYIHRSLYANVRKRDFTRHIVDEPWRLDLYRMVKEHNSPNTPLDETIITGGWILLPIWLRQLPQQDFGLFLKGAYVRMLGCMYLYKQHMIFGPLEASEYSLVVLNVWR